MESLRNNTRLSKKLLTSLVFTNQYATTHISTVSTRGGMAKAKVHNALATTCITCVPVPAASAGTSLLEFVFIANQRYLRGIETARHNWG
jgi:hypothetical protein